MKKYRVLAIILAAMMIVAMFAGCSNDTAKKDDASSSSSSSSSASTDKKEDKKEETPAADSGEKTKIKYSSKSQYQTEPISWLETDIWKYIQDQANVEIEYQYLDGDKYNLMLASGDMGDIIWGSGVTDKIADIVDSKLAYDIEPLIADKIPNLGNEVFAAAIEILKNTACNGEGLYFLPEHVGVELPDGGAYVARGYNVRWDWYKEIGAPEINNDEEYVAALEAMVAAHPETENGEKVYAAGISDSFANWGYHSVFTTAMTNPWTFSGYLFQQSVRDPSVMIDGYRDVENSAYWRSLKFYNALWNKGLLDPDSFTMTSDELKTKEVAGRYACTPNNASSNLYNEMRKTDPETLAGHISIPSDGQFWFANNSSPSGWFPSYVIFVAHNTKNIDAVCRFLDVIYNLDTQRLFFIGFEGDTWNYVDGVPTLTDEYLQMIADGDQKIKEIGIGVSCGWTVLMESEYHSDGYLLKPSALDKDTMVASLTPLQADLAAHYGVDLPSEAMKAKFEAGIVPDLSGIGTELIGGSMKPLTQDVKRILENCNDALYKRVYDLVTAPTEADFAAIQAEVLAEFEAANIQEAWDFAIAEFEHAYEVTNPLLREFNEMQAAKAAK